MEQSECDSQGMLYLCATPIGNLGDMTYRAVEMLKSADIIAAEATRHTRKLLSHFGIHTPLVSYHEHNKYEKGPILIDEMLSGKTVVCVSDAGMPGISDPGSHLVELAISAGIDVSPLPGANAALSALICSGLDTRQFFFVGFLPRTGQKRREVLEDVSGIHHTLIFYEAPHHLRATLKDLCDALGSDRRAVAARELTKKFEEFRRDTLGGLCMYYNENEPRGEFVIIVDGMSDTDAGGNEDSDMPHEKCLELAVQMYDRLIADGTQKKEAMRTAAHHYGISRRDVYQEVEKRK